VQEEIEALIDKRGEKDPDFKGTVELVKDFLPLYCPENEPVVSIIGTSTATEYSSLTFQSRQELEIEVRDRAFSETLEIERKIPG